MKLYSSLPLCVIEIDLFSYLDRKLVECITEIVWCLFSDDTVAFALSCKSVCIQREPFNATIVLIFKVTILPHDERTIKPKLVSQHPVWS